MRPFSDFAFRISHFPERGPPGSACSELQHISRHRDSEESYTSSREQRRVQLRATAAGLLCRARYSRDEQGASETGVGQGSPSDQARLGTRKTRKGGSGNASQSFRRDARVRRRREHAKRYGETAPRRYSIRIFPFDSAFNRHSHQMRSMLLYLEAARYKVGGTLAEVEGSKRGKHPLAEYILVSRDKQGLQQSVLKVNPRI